MMVADIKKPIFLVTLALLLLVSAASQPKNFSYPVSYSSLRLQPAKLPGFINPHTSQVDVPRFSIRTTPLVPDYYVRQLGWTCRQEYRFEKRSGLPLRLRLGSLGYTNWLEGKSFGILSER
jgi:hypothetical protein